MTTPPPVRSGRDATATVRSCIATSCRRHAGADARLLDRLAQRVLAREELAREGQRRLDAEQRARPLIDPDHHAALVHREHAFLERLEHGGHELVVRLERIEARRELLGHAVQRGGEIADLAGRGERRPPREITGRDRARDVAQLDDGLRDAAREEKRERERAEQRERVRSRGRRAARRARSRRGCAS